MNYLRKRPRQARSQATFEAIVEAAARILAEGGDRALTTNRIAERAGVSIGSLYQYFPNRGAIVRALLLREGAKAEALRPAALDEHEMPRAERVRALVDWYCDVHGAEPRLARALATLVAQVLPREEIERFEDLRRRRAACTLSSLARSPTFDVETAVFVVGTCLDALCERALVEHPDWLNSERLRAEVARMLDRYLCG